MGESGGFRICRIFGIDIIINITWIPIFFLIVWSVASLTLPAQVPDQPQLHYWLAAVLTVIVFFISVLIHEISHSLVAKRFGISVKSITLVFFGGVASLGRTTDNPKEEFLMSGAGPVSSVVLAVFFYSLYMIGAGHLPSLMTVSLFYLAFINAILAVFNLLPGFPMDGGRVLRAILWWRLKDEIKATKIAVITGKAFSCLMIGAGTLFIFMGNLFGLMWILVGFILFSAAGREYSLILLKNKLRGVKAKDLMLRAPYGVDGREVGDIISCQPDDEAMKVLGIMDDQRARRIFVQERGTIVGVIERSQIERIILNK